MTQDIAALLGSRICHDLISPLGAISNGVELLEMSGAQMGPELQLISESVENANARIRFFRVAFGIASPEQSIGARELRTILDDLAKGSRMRVEWEGPADVPRAEAKLIFLTLLCLETAMPWGGITTVRKQQQEWAITGRSERMKIDADLWASLADSLSTTQHSAAEVQFVLLPLLCRELGRSLTLEMSETEITARI